MSFKFLPSLQANFTPIPEEFFTDIFSDSSVTKEELVVSLFCFNTSGGWQNSQTLLHFELIMEHTSLNAVQAQNGLALAARRNTLIELPSEDGKSKKLYMLNLPANRQFVETYYTSSETPQKSSTEPPTDPVPAASAPAASAPAAPAPAAPAPAAPAPAAPVPAALAPAASENTFEDEDYFGYDEDEDLIPFEDEVPVFEEGSGETPFEETAPEPVYDHVPSAPVYEDDVLSAPVYEDEVDEAFAADVSTTPVPTPSPFEDNIPSPDSSEWIPPGMSLPFQKRTVEMIGSILGRKLSKIETERLADLGASDDSLIEAMSSLLSRTKKIYSSDLIIYEYEQLKSNERTSSKYEAAKAQRKEQIERQKNCMRCGGLGFTFKGLSTVLECDCRKT